MGGGGGGLPKMGGCFWNGGGGGVLTPLRTMAFNVLAAFDQCNTQVTTSIIYFQSFSAKVSIGSQPAFTCSNLTIETLEQGVKYVQS